MSVHLIHSERARNAQNAHVQMEMGAAMACVEELARDGFTVLRVEVEGGRPVIWIQACGRCSRLGGSWYRRAHTGGGLEFTWQAEVGGCRVQWKTKGA